MKTKFEIYCALFKTNPKKMRPLLHRYFGTPEYIRDLSIEEYYARKNGQLFRGREPRQFIDLCMDLQLKKARYEKLLEIHESGLFQNILDADTEWADDNKDLIEKNLFYWESVLNNKSLNIAGARKIYEYAPEVHDEE